MIRLWLCVLALGLLCSLAIADPPRCMQRDGRTYVQVRYISESLGAQVTFDKASLSVSIVRATDVIVLPVKHKKAKVNGRMVVLESSPFIYAGVTYVPLRFIGESLSVQVQWVPTTYEVVLIDAHAGKTLRLTSKKYVSPHRPNPGIGPDGRGAPGLLKKGHSHPVMQPNQGNNGNEQGKHNGGKH